MMMMIVMRDEGQFTVTDTFSPLKQTLKIHSLTRLVAGSNQLFENLQIIINTLQRFILSGGGAVLDKLTPR